MATRTLTLTTDADTVAKDGAEDVLHSAEDVLHSLLRTLAPLGAGISATLATLELVTVDIVDVTTDGAGDIEHFLYAAGASVLAGLLGLVHKFVNNKLLIEDALRAAESVVEDS